MAVDRPRNPHFLGLNLPRQHLIPLRSILGIPTDRVFPRLDRILVEVERHFLYQETRL